MLIDCGLGLRQLQAALAADGLSPTDLDGVFITHEHGDHIGCVAMLAARYRVPIWTSAGTAQSLKLPHDADAPVHHVGDGQVFSIRGLEFRPFTVPHDAREPLQLRCSDGAAHLGVLTDLGHASSHVLQQLQGCHALMIEANHDPDMLAASRYPPFLKRRVGGLYGHLANTATAEILRAVQHDGLQRVVAAHLSAQNNLPALARQSLAAALGWADEEIQVASPTEGTLWFDVNP